MNIVIFIIILLVLVIVHEFGHFYSAKKFGIRVDEFGFGFPPKLFGIKKGETEYTFNLLPIGGFVKIFGENPDDENTNGPDRERSFVHKAKWKQAIVLGAGVFANFLLAWLLFSFGFMSGMPTSVGSESKGSNLKDVHLVVVSVLGDSPADHAGLQSGDKILGVRNEKTAITNDITPDTFRDFVISTGEGELTIAYMRGGETGEYNIQPKVNESGVPAIGISMDEIGIAKLPFFMALKEGMSLTANVTKSTAVGLYTLIKDAIMGQGSLSGVTGPVGMVGIVGDAYTLGFAYLLSFAALISINLGIINLVPFPALDGGRLFFLLIEKIKGSPINPKVANTLNTIGFGILILFMIFITYHDVANLF
ncbi:MAG: RIP metalloprotease RseP [Candidatus Pacebacteria bacterium]|jgi:regulator of sigma E protease|nr:RIP metalloprotease RseP [Candidatus Paceibacterota bacterium]